MNKFKGLDKEQLEEIFKVADSSLDETQLSILVDILNQQVRALVSVIISSPIENNQAIIDQSIIEQFSIISKHLDRADHRLKELQSSKYQFSRPCTQEEDNYLNKALEGLNEQESRE